MEERRLPGETEARWSLARDGEVWTYRVWASPYLPEEVRAFPGARQVVWRMLGVWTGYWLPGGR
jgi:hypothetical protein